MGNNKFISRYYTGQYYITDCEHEGDISYAIYEVEQAGGIVDGTEWDGNDCGEAWVYFHCNSPEELDKVTKELGID